MVTKKPAELAKFYGALFGWKFSTENGLAYRMTTADSSNGVGGGIWPGPPETPEIVQLYVEVENIRETLALIAKLGGQALMEEQLLPDGDAMALALDPLGRSFGIMRSNSA
jgi:predicted enzyme related to lactoylglutathione lyase